MNNYIPNPIKFMNLSISDLIAGITLILVSAIVFLDMFYILRNPIFSGIIGILFFLAAICSFNLNKYRTNRERFLNSDLNSMIAAIALLFISILGVTGHFEMVRSYLFPLIPGFLLLIVGFSRIYLKARDSKIVITRIDPVGTVGGEVLVFYSILLYMDMTALAWSPVFPLIIVGAFITTYFLSSLSQVDKEHSRIHEEIDVAKDVLEDSIGAITQKYELKAVTFASNDGFVIASNSDNATDEAAKYSYILNQHREVDIEDSLIFVNEGIYVDHINLKGSEVVYILSSEELLHRDELDGIRIDVKEIFNKTMNVDEL